MKNINLEVLGAQPTLVVINTKSATLGYIVTKTLKAKHRQILKVTK